jgi:hypothetical protein
MSLAPSMSGPASAYLVKPINPNRLLRKLAASGLTE